MTRWLPHGLLVVIVNESIFRDQGRTAERSFTDDDAIEGIFCPGLGARRRDYFGQGSIGKLQADPLAEILNHLFTWLVHTPDLPQKVDLQDHDRRDEEIIAVQRATGGIRQQRCATGIEPHYNVSI